MIKHGMSVDEIHSAGHNGATRDNKAKVLDSFYLYTDKEEGSVGRWLASDGYWESWITSWMTKNVPLGGICIDIGANYGYYTLLMQGLVGEHGGVYSFEANPELCSLIAKSIAEAPEGYSPAALYNVAVSDNRGMATLDIPSKLIGGSTIMFGEQLPSSVEPIVWDKRIEVPCDTLDNIIEPQKIDVIKMDIEGAEPLAWKGMQETLKNTDVVILEMGSYSPKWFIDELYDNWAVSMVNSSTGDEIPLNKEVVPYLPDLIMAVLRKRNV